MKYSEIKTEQIRDNLWIAKTILDTPLNCEVSVEGKNEVEAIRKLEFVLAEE